ncbi:MAG: hypothetical protein P1V51_19900 [Deltaproteobacteria bacterium]|nr:hypothetical protein [Deltaproteobacteria bacterium]
MAQTNRQTDTEVTTRTATLRETRKVTFYIPAGLHRELKSLAAFDDRPMSDMVTNVLEEYARGRRRG